MTYIPEEVREQIEEAKRNKSTRLDLSSCKLTDISFLRDKALTQLTELYLYNNQLTDISPLKALTQLTSLYLRYNQLTDISPLKALTQLTRLHLENNQISDISPILPLIKLGKLQVTLEDKSWSESEGYLVLYNNPITTPPIDIVGQGNTAIIEYFKDLEEQGEEYLYEAKLLILGEGGAGKTTLSRKIQDLSSPLPEKQHDRTRGIDIQALPIPNIHPTHQPFRMNVWDFGGQGYYHSTHQFFLTKRSLYVIVNNTRLNNTDFNHWLQTVSVFSENSPVIILQNKVAGSEAALDLHGLKQHFPNIITAEIADLSNIEDGRVQQLIQRIQSEIQLLPHVGNELPAQWVKVREAILEKSREHPYIDVKDYYSICRNHKITKKEAMKRLSDFLHDLGVFLHFQKDEVLGNTVILQNAWATKGVYHILDSEIVRQQKGYFSTEQAEHIWENTPFEDMHHQLIQLMRKFELCFRIPYETAYISPNLLPLEKPQYHWDNHNNLIILYDYVFMPKGLLGRLIVRLHRYIKDINTMAWRTGCVFTYENTDAQVVETYGAKKLEIRLRGDNCIVLSSIIIKEIDELNKGFERIQVEKLLPCNCHECKNSDRPHFYSYKNLMKRRAKGKRTVECDNSYEDVNVIEVLEGAYSEKAVAAQNIPNLVARNKIEAALSILEETHSREATLLLARYNAIIERQHKDTIKLEEFNLEMSKIRDSILAYHKER